MAPVDKLVVVPAEEEQGVQNRCRDVQPEELVEKDLERHPAAINGFFLAGLEFLPEKRDDGDAQPTLMAADASIFVDSLLSLCPLPFGRLPCCCLRGCMRLQ